MTKKAFRFALWILFPKVCLNCREDLDWRSRSFLCRKCLCELRREAAFRCLRCHKAIDNGETCFNCRGRKGRKFKCSLIRSAFAYNAPASALVAECKYKGKAYVGKFMGKLMAGKFREFGEFAGFDTLMPVPLSERKLKKRGFNQSGLLAAALSEKIKISVNGFSLVKTRDNASQTSLKADGRKENVKGVFAVAEVASVEGKKIILVDDVATTGATLEEAAATLKKAGAARVAAFTFAREG